MTYPKDGERRLRESIKQLKMQVSRLRKENTILREELDNIMKPVRPRKEHVEAQSPKMMTQDEWRRNFIKEYRPGIKKRLEEVRNESEEDPET